MNEEDDEDDEEEEEACQKSRPRREDRKQEVRHDEGGTKARQLRSRTRVLHQTPDPPFGDSLQ